MGFLTYFFNKRRPTNEEKRFDFIATLVADWTLMVLADAARLQENSWSDRTRYTVIGYVVGATKESFPSGTKLEIEHTIFLAYQRLCSTSVLKAEIMEKITNLDMSNNKYFQAGRAAATQDYDAIRNKRIVHGFFDALQFPQDRL